MSSFVPGTSKYNHKAGENMSAVDNFDREKDFLICIDSDGSAIDTMTEKHQKCFGPEAVKVWNLENIEDQFLKKWDKVNLYSNTRGINRFKALLKTFNELRSEGFDLPKINNVENWTKNSSELSNPALKEEINNKNDSRDLKIALQWSQQVNQKISELEKDISKVFDNVKNALQKIADRADLAVVSSANHEALVEEWQSYDLDKFVKVILGQEAGSKADNIKDLKAKGYAENNILMIGDAPGDLEAAQANNVSFYPIVPCEEEESWQKFVEEAADKFLNGKYQGKYEKELINNFRFILK